MKRCLLLSLALIALPAGAQNDTGYGSFRGVFATCADMVYQGNGELAPDLFARCGEIVGAGLSGSFDEALIVGRDELGAVGRNATEAAVAQGSQLAARMSDVRAGASGFSIADLRLDPSGERLASASALAGLGNHHGGAAGDDAGGSRLGLFLNGSGAFGDREAGAEDVGFDFESTGLTLGMDYRFSDRFFAGLAYGYSSADNDLTGGGGVEGNGRGMLDITGHSLSLYASVSASESVFVDGHLLVGKNDYESSTEVIYSIPSGGGLTHVNQIALSDTEGDLVSGGLSIGHNLIRGGFTMMSVLRGDFSNLDIDSYDERFSSPGGTGGQLNLRIGDQEVKSLTSTLELTFSYAKSTSWGVFLPQLRAGWTHQFEDDARIVSTRLLADPNFDRGITTPPEENPLPLPDATPKDLFVFTDEPDRDYGNLGLGFSAVFRNGHQAFLFWDTALSRGDLSYNAFSGGFRFAL